MISSYTTRASLVQINNCSPQDAPGKKAASSLLPLLHCTSIPLPPSPCPLCSSYIMTLFPPCCTDPAGSREKQPDPAFLSETGSAAAPRPGYKHCRTGSARQSIHDLFVFAPLTLPPICFQGDGAALCARSAAGVYFTRCRGDGGDSSC